LSISAALAPWQEGVETVSYIVAIVAAAGASWTYHRNSQRERAKWAVQLYEKFYEENRYKAMREAFDCDANSAEAQSIVEEEQTAFTDYLNFFELVCILVRNKQLRKADVLDLFQYYLGCLARHKAVVDYIGTHGFEQLDRFLKEQSFAGKA
jgi:hypothetical protein